MMLLPSSHCVLPYTLFLKECICVYVCTVFPEVIEECIEGVSATGIGSYIEQKFRMYVFNKV